MKLCPQCGAIFDGHRWVPEPDEALMKLAETAHAARQLCPGDLRIEKRQVEGVVTLKGGFLADHQGEIRNLVNRVANHGRARNVAARIFEVHDKNGELEIETTDDHLAERIGKEVEKAFKGDLEIKWQDKNRFARVVWQRD